MFLCGLFGVESMHHDHIMFYAVSLPHWSQQQLAGEILFIMEHVCISWKSFFRERVWEREKGDVATTIWETTHSIPFHASCLLSYRPLIDFPSYCGNCLKKCSQTIPEQELVLFSLKNEIYVGKASTQPVDTQREATLGHTSCARVLGTVSIFPCTRFLRCNASSANKVA